MQFAAPEIESASGVTSITGNFSSSDTAHSTQLYNGSYMRFPFVRPNRYVSDGRLEASLKSFLPPTNTLTFIKCQFKKAQVQ